MPHRTSRQSLIRAVAIPLLAAVLLLVAASSAGSATTPLPMNDVPPTSAVTPMPPPAQDFSLVGNDTGPHESGPGNLPAAVLVGLAVSGTLAALLLLGAAGFILPKPPRR